MGQLIEKLSLEKWRDLIEITRIVIQFFNRNPSVEIERFLFHNFNSRRGINEEISLTSLTKKYRRISVVEKPNTTEI